MTHVAASQPAKLLPPTDPSDAALATADARHRLATAGLPGCAAALRWLACGVAVSYRDTLPGEFCGCKM